MEPKSAEVVSGWMDGLLNQDLFLEPMRCNIDQPGMMESQSACDATVWGALPPSPPRDGPSARGLYFRRSTHIQTSIPSSIDVRKTKSMMGQMYCELLEPLLVLQPNPIVLIHGDFHTGQVSLGLSVGVLMLLMLTSY